MKGHMSQLQKRGLLTLSSDSVRESLNEASGSSALCKVLGDLLQKTTADEQSVVMKQLGKKDWFR
jgi:hypothetical protein